MPQADRLVPSKPAAREAQVAGWGGGPSVAVSLIRPEDLEALRVAIRFASGNAITRGLGRSYGDAAQLRDGIVIETTGLKHISLDPDAGAVTTEAGATIGELMARLVPAGWMVPVVPGTQHVTVGGAIASDIHGKNHGVAGTFGQHVEQISLLTSDDELRELGAGDPLFDATLGGMGLTGVICAARIKLRAITSPLVEVDTDRVGSLDEALAALKAPGGPYRVAWLDLLSARPARGVVTRAEHIDDSREHRNGGATVRARATVPRGWPSGVLRPSTVRAFNALRYARSPRAERGRPEGIAHHMFPLDALERWPRLYGPDGFLQYQFVVPFGEERVLEAAIDRLRKARVPCYLAVLKDFGPANGAPLSFPIAGWTLTLDVPRSASGLGPLLDAFDRLVVEAGGRVYLSKDARMKPEVLGAMYPRLEEWRTVRAAADPRGMWCSDLATRVGLV
jgi:decaprenylphospho-beta-D-ribofuranose 2-oxidase